MWWFNFVFGCKFFKPVLFFSVSEYDDVRQRKIKLVLKSLNPPTPPLPHPPTPIKKHTMYIIYKHPRPLINEI